MNHHPTSLIISDVATNPSCNTVADGAIDVTVSGGTLPYMYQWSGGSTATTEDLPAVLEAAETVVAPYIRRAPSMDRNSIMLGYAGAYSSFLLHAEKAAQRYGVPAHEILNEVGRRRYVGGQEDLIIDVALALASR